MSSSQTESLHFTRVPFAETGMLIRKPVAEVFEAIVNPEITTKFWFTRSSGRLAVGRPIRWDWEMYDVSVEVTVQTIDNNRRIVIEWPGYSGTTTVEWTFAPLADGNTFVRVTESGFSVSSISWEIGFPKESKNKSSQRISWEGSMSSVKQERRST